MLADEYGTASNIKSRVNRLSVLGAITSTQQKLKLFTRVPDNGLIIYCGTIVTDEGKEKKGTLNLLGRHIGPCLLNLHSSLQQQQQSNHNSNLHSQY